MLYGIAVVVLAAVIFLIVYNLKAYKTAAPSKPSVSQEPVRSEEQSVRSGEQHTRSQEPARRPEQPMRSQEPAPAPPRAAAPSYRGKVDDTLIPTYAAAPTRSDPPNFAPRASGRTTTRSTSIYREQSDDEYRQALRGFSESGKESEPAAVQEGSLPPRRGKDADYREGLRSLNRREPGSDSEWGRKEHE